MSIVEASLPDRIYETAFQPELWDGILEDITKLTGARFASIVMYLPQLKVLSHHNKPAQKLQNSPESQKFIESVINDLRSASLLNAGFFESDASRDELRHIRQRERLAQEFARQDIGPQVGALTDTGNGSVISLKFGRWIGEGAFAQSSSRLVGTIYPAYLQALRFSSLLHFNRARGALEALTALNRAAAVIASSGHIIHQNALFESMGHYVVRSASGRVELRGSDAQKKEFACALARADRGGVSFAVPACPQRRAAMINILPVRRSTADIFAPACRIMTVSPLGLRGGIPGVSLLQDLFALTPAEAQLAHHLASGLSLNAAAIVQGITIGTARAYLHRIFSKTETRQQSELVSLLKGGAI